MRTGDELSFGTTSDVFPEDAVRIVKERYNEGKTSKILFQSFI